MKSMAINDTQRIMATPAPTPVVADPGPLGLAAFALTTFVLSAHNAGLFGFDKHANTIVIGLAIFYGGLAQFMAGMWAFRNRNVFSATAFSTWTRWYAVVIENRRQIGAARIGSSTPGKWTVSPRICKWP